jgi:hypothetical protein
MQYGVKIEIRYESPEDDIERWEEAEPWRRTYIIVAMVSSAAFASFLRRKVSAKDLSASVVNVGVPGDQ